MTQISVVATITVTPESKAALLPHLEVLETTTLKEEDGCLFYRMHEDSEDPNTLVCVELWEDREALEAHFNAPHFVAHKKNTEGMAESVSIRILKPLF